VQPLSAGEDSKTSSSPHLVCGTNPEIDQSKSIEQLRLTLVRGKEILSFVGWTCYDTFLQTFSPDSHFELKHGIDLNGLNS
jgi:hypothetical protein